MKITKKNTEALWYSTESYFGKLDPQPEIQIRPLTRREKIDLLKSSTRQIMLPHPEKPGQFLQAEEFDKFAFSQKAVEGCVVGLKYFEREDGTPLEATPEDIDYLIEELGIGFETWLQEMIKAASDQDDARKEDSRKNF